MTVLYKCSVSSCLIFQSSQVSLQTLMFAEQSLHTGQITTKVIRGHQLLLLLDPTDGLIHIPIVGIKHTGLYLTQLACRKNKGCPHVALMFTC